MQRTIDRQARHTHAHIARWLCRCVFVCGVQSCETGTRQRLAARRQFCLDEDLITLLLPARQPFWLRSAMCSVQGSVCLCVESAATHAVWCHIHPDTPAARLWYACAGARAAWRCRWRGTLQHTAVPLLLCLDKAPHADRPVRQHTCLETQEALQCSRQLFVVCSAYGWFCCWDWTENSCAQDRDRRCACIELLTLVACAAWCWLLSQAGYSVVAGGIRAGLPVPLFVDSCSVCCVVDTGGAPPRGQLANSCVRPAVPFALQLCAPSAAFLLVEWSTLC